MESPTGFALSIAALGIVYGDIGTSPLYAIRESLDGLPINLTDVLGVLSLIFWSLIFVISIKYLVVLFRADNDGEGGILALLALLKQFLGDKARFTFLIGIFGAGLMLGDGMLTPAISVISAIEGFYVIAPSLSNWVMPLTLIILIALFSVQSYGTAKIGFVFGPIIFIWFVILALLGTTQILHNPIVLKAINPLYAIEFFREHGWKGYAHLGGVFLVVTGGEALYADMGHLGKYPIRISWFMVALPALLLNYFGQGAYLLNHPEAIVNPFYLIAPNWFLVPLLIIATMATIIASQAVISATFSLTKQAVLLGLYPHLPIKQTSDVQKGQIYVPQMNFILAIGTMILILTFKNSNALAHAYGIAVNLVMILTSMLIAYFAIKKWQWNPFIIILMFSFFGVIDLAFLGANIQKLLTGGWVPITFALACAFIMYTWQSGMRYLREHYYIKKDELSKVLKQLDYKSITKLPGKTIVFITDIYDKSGGSLLHFLKFNQVLPEHILVVNFTVENIPYVSSANQFEVKCLSKNICELTLHYGFMDTVSIPQALYVANDRNILPFSLNIETASYLMEIPTVLASRQKKTMEFYWQEKLFAFLVRNYSININIEFYQLPYNRTMALGTYYII
ncbi:KUP/HAK/KT family potassium transporter [Legionella sp. 27fs60]|uniref:Probable potassium transport system protein Kup n=1 Tax=Legionella bononiensis TaxID=2793102 RepID=A0ABS1WBY0_9GAMM|nr:KUP/HAK/KT family potassium transporter [Legionella bononiensis]MBL7526867.1 KUP/HAK/KT family potassium transporter [Legionella bononiensis]MBL7564274.1 KUP/HAK/KT family potassium transporter [Legionella bononiensis]